MSSNRKIMLIAAAVGVPVVLYLAFVVFGVQTLFIDDKVDEAAPQFESGASSAEPATGAETSSENVPGTVVVAETESSGENAQQSDGADEEAMTE